MLKYNVSPEKGRCKQHLGDYSIGVPPLPIPNREVKPNSANGTAYRGRVGRRQTSKSHPNQMRLFF